MSELITVSLFNILWASFALNFSLDRKVSQTKRCINITVGFQLVPIVVELIIELFTTWGNFICNIYRVSNFRK